MLAPLDGTEMSAKAYAIGDMNRGSAGAHSAKDWASESAATTRSTDSTSQRKYAEEAASSAASASGSLSSFQAVYLGDGSLDPNSGHGWRPVLQHLRKQAEVFFRDAVDRHRGSDRQRLSRFRDSDAVAL